MSNYPPLPELFQVSTLMRPMLSIKPQGVSKVSIQFEQAYTPTDVLPPEIWHQRVREVKETIQSEHPLQRFDSFAEAYNFISKIRCYPSYDATKFARNPDLESSMVTSPGDMLLGKNDMQMFMNYMGYLEPRPNLQQDWDDFWSITPDYKAHPDNFYYAYHWVNRHPLFWQLKGNAKKDEMLHWETNNTFAQLWHTVISPTAGQPGQHMLEGGPTVCSSAEFSKNIISCIPKSVATLDYDLTAHGYTYEEAIVNFAAQIKKKYPLIKMMTWLYEDCTHMPEGWA